MKKKPARIKGRIVYALELVENSAGCTLRFSDRPKYIELPINNPEALVEQVARALGALDGWSGAWWSAAPKGAVGDYRNYARAALRSIGVPLKK